MRIYFILVPFFVFSIASCSSNGGSNKKDGQDVQKNSPDKSPLAGAENQGPGGEVLSFVVNDTLARTNKTTGGDTDEHIGIYTQGSKTLSLELYGDVPTRPHRGWLKFNLKNFKFEPTTYTLSSDHSASFSRYATIDGGGEAVFTANSHPANKGTEMTITFTKLTKVQGNLNNTEYLADGTFSARLYNQIYSATRLGPPTIVRITDGRFEKIRIIGGLGTTLE
jgi:hypothetical protein